jgi:hypothetical protein
MSSILGKHSAETLEVSPKPVKKVKNVSKVLKDAATVYQWLADHIDRKLYEDESPSAAIDAALTSQGISHVRDLKCKASKDFYNFFVKGQMAQWFSDVDTKIPDEAPDGLLEEVVEPMEFLIETKDGYVFCATVRKLFDFDDFTGKFTRIFNSMIAYVSNEDNQVSLKNKPIVGTILLAHDQLVSNGRSIKKDAFIGSVAYVTKSDGRKLPIVFWRQTIFVGRTTDALFQSAVNSNAERAFELLKEKPISNDALYYVTLFLHDKFNEAFLDAYQESMFCVKPSLELEWDPEDLYTYNEDPYKVETISAEDKPAEDKPVEPNTDLTQTKNGTV